MCDWNPRIVITAAVRDNPYYAAPCLLRVVPRASQIGIKHSSQAQDRRATDLDRHYPRTTSRDSLHTLCGRPCRMPPSEAFHHDRSSDDGQYLGSGGNEHRAIFRLADASSNNSPAR
jgi:hypothetical protein